MISFDRSKNWFENPEARRYCLQVGPYGITYVKGMNLDRPDEKRFTIYKKTSEVTADVLYYKFWGGYHE